MNKQSRIAAASDISKEFHPACQAFVKYWDSLECDEGLIPPRSQFRPEDIPRLLPNLILVELVSADIIETRLAGSNVMQSFGFDPKGHNYLDYVQPERRAIASANMWAVHKQPCGVWALAEQRYPEGKAVQSEMLGLPLFGEGKRPLALFIQQTVREPRYLDREKCPRPVNEILDLKFLDIGAGVPSLP